MAFIDSTEQQQIQSRLEDNKRRKTYYSGTKKKHTVKLELMVNNQDIVIHETRYKKGRKHDYISGI